VDFIDKIPESWKIMKARFLFKEISEKNRAGSELLSVYREYGVIPKSSREDNKNIPSEDLSTYKFVEKGDLVFNKMKTWQGSIAVSDYEGIVSPAYYVAKFTKANILRTDFAHFLLRSKIYIAKYGSISTGIRPGQWDMGFDAFNDVYVLLPSVEEQELIVEYIKKETNLTDIFINKIQLQIDKLDEYLVSLIYSAVTGKIKI
jgi:type I restriction enzyme S subunit